MRILLTGSKGNLGTHLQARGSQHEWLGLDRDGWTKPEMFFEKPVDLVVHAASDVLTSVACSPSSVFDSNCMSTMKLLELCQRFHVPRFVFISSCAVYGRSQVTAEDTPLAPISLNGLMKAACEKAVEQFCGYNEIKFEIYRPFNLYGGRDRFSILSHLRRSMVEGKPFQLNNNGLSQRDFIHVEDVAEVLLRCFERVNMPSHLNIGSGVATRIGDIVARVQARFPDLKVQSSTRQEAEYSRGDNSLLVSLLGPFPFRDVLKFIESEWYLD